MHIENAKNHGVPSSEGFLWSRRLAGGFFGFMCFSDRYFRAATGGNNIEGKKNKGGGERASATHNNNNNNKRYSRAPTGGNNMDRTECPPRGHCVKLGCGGGNISSLNEAISTTNLVSKQFVPEIRVLSWYTLLRKVRGTNCFEKKFHDTNCFKNFVVQICLEAICTTNFCISFL
jgi:hypothetical protein